MMRVKSSSLCVTGLAAIILAALSMARVPAQTTPAAPFAVEYYYKVKWGYFDEFMELYKRNHYPVLQRQQKLGRIVRMSAAFPLNHASEASRWDMRYTIVWKDVATAHDDFDPAPILKELYPDQAKFKKEEQRRFELLLEHMDIPVFLDDLTAWGK
jgi:hypothetical protein